MARTRQRSMPRRQRVWARQTGTFSPAANDRAQASLDSQFSTEYGTTRLPVGTTIGGLVIHYQSTQTSARAGDTDAFWLGIGVFDESTAVDVPNPYSEPHADWMWRQQVPTQTADGSTTSPVLACGGPVRVKSMRKIAELNLRPWLVVHNFGSTTVDFHYDVSLMLLLP